MSYKQIKDEEFLRDKVPMTKADIRTLSIIKMEIDDGETVWDIGAGTGSISIEIAKNYPSSQVFSIERNSKGIELIKRNIEHFGIENMNVIEGLAPEAFKGLPEPDKVIIGGSGGNLDKILDILFEYKATKNVVINAITINTAFQAMKYLKEHDIEFEANQINVSNVEMIKDYQMLKAQNPIFIIGAKK